MVRPCCYMLFNKNALLMLNNATAHWQYSPSLDVAVNSKSILIALISVALDNFTFGIVTSVSNFVNDS